MDGIDRLRKIVRTLRAPGGCPWDREQTLKTLKPCLLEETYELLHAIDTGNEQDHLEELGDVLLQIVFQCDIRESEGKFTLDDVANAVADKMVRRHPHVFGDVKVDSVSQVLRNWENIKKGETHGNPERSALDGVPPTLPALLKAQRVQQKAARVGFDWKDSSGALEKMEEELAEVKEAVAEQDQAHIEEEIGDLFFAIVNTCRFLNVQAEESLTAATRKFETRFRAVEAEVRRQGKEMKNCTLAELDAIWDQVKDAQRKQDGNQP